MTEHFIDVLAQEFFVTLATPLAPSQSMATGLASSQTMVAATSNLGGVQKHYCMKKAKDCKTSGERVLSTEYQRVLRNQVGAMLEQGANIIVWTELNNAWSNWLRDDMKSDARFQGWELYHDGWAVVIMRGPGFATVTSPVAVKVYNEAMLAADPCKDRSRLEWRTIFSGEFRLRHVQEHPIIHLNGLHVYSGGDGLEHNAKITEPQKRRVSFESIICGFRENPSIVAGLEEGKCMMIYIGDWNLGKEAMTDECNSTETALRSRS